ncbi:MAG TPA: hypothetical protein VLW84_09230 [Terriglobales bacterium]|nr:hypothetical protein [Terriglobales bacterium]
MDDRMGKACSICGEQKSGDETWFLVVENRWEDKLTVLQWNEQLAGCEGFSPACSPDHVEELVVHWMTTGSLDYPFARTSLGAKAHRGSPSSVAPDLRGMSPPRQLGELLIHRESVERVLNERPESLRGVLEALACALQKGAEPGRILPQSSQIEKQGNVPRAS